MTINSSKYIFLILSSILLSGIALGVSADVTVKDSQGIKRPVDSLCVDSSSISEKCKSGASQFSFELGNKGDYEFSIEDDRYQNMQSTVYVWQENQSATLTVSESSQESGEISNVEVNIKDNSGIRRPVDKITIEKVSGSWTKTKNDLSSFTFDAPSEGNYRFKISDDSYKAETREVYLWTADQTVDLAVQKKDTSQPDQDYTIKVRVEDDSGVLRPVNRLTLKDESGDTVGTVYDRSKADFTVESAGNYNLDVRDETWDERTGSVYIWEDGQPATLKVEKEDEVTGKKPSIDLRAPENGATDVSRNPVYRWKITDSDDNQLVDTTIYVEEQHFSSDKPWNQPVHKYDVSDAVGSVQSYSSTTTWLDPNKKYVWGIKAEDGDHVVRSETYSFKTQGTTNNQEGSLKVTVRDGEYDRLENAHVRIKNGDYRTGRTNGIGKVKFANLDPDWYDIRVRCDGETETDRINVHSNEDETITIDMDQNSDDDYCGDDSDDSEPEASFTVSDTNPEIGERVTFDASASNGNIMEYRWSFPDGTTKYGKTVSRSFESSGNKEVKLSVTEYDYDQDTHSRTITVQRRDDDDGEENEDPTARLDINPSSAEIGEEIEFDATDSSDEGDIEEYEFDLDGDGDWDVENNEGTVERSFFEEFEGEARVRVTDDDGNTDTADANYEVQARSRVSISDLDAPNKVCDGESFETSFQVRNLGDNDRFVVIEGRGFGSRRSAVASLDEDERRSMSIKFTAGSPGSRTITLSAANSNTVRKTIEVLDCRKQADEVSDLSVSVNPQRVNAGESVKVSGYVENARGREDVRILVDGSLGADISTQPDGYYSAYVYPEEVGRSSIVVSSGSKTVRSSVEVLPTVQISSLEVKNNIFQGETFQICAQVNSQVDPLVVLTRNGERIASTHDRGRVCFDTVSNTAGETEYKIGAYAKGAGDSISRKVQILETKPETSSFPEKIASVESGDGIVKATIYNNHQDQRRYDVQISGLPNTWTSTTEKQVILQPGEQREVFFYLTPQEEGRYQPQIKIDSRGTTIYETKVDVISGGTSDAPENSLLAGLRNALPW